MNRENLPQIRKENIQTKIKKWLLKFFRRGESSKYETVDIIENQSKKSNIFKENIKLENKDKILNLQKELKDNQIRISDLTNEELNEMIELYKSQIEEKKIKLKQYRIKLAKTN